MTLDPTAAPRASASVRTPKIDRGRPRRGARLLRGAAWAAVGLGAAAAVNNLMARRAEGHHPPEGAFLTIDGVRLHYREAGSGPPVVLLHGNGVASDDFVVSGLMGRLARNFRVIAIDRPGFGWSERPRGRAWTAWEQALLLLRALEDLGAEGALLVGHSWGSLVAAEMGLAAPEALSGLVLMSGYYRPTPRPDTVMLGAPAVPVLGDLMRHTLSPPMGRMMLPLVLKQLFAPAEVDPRFRRAYPLSMSLRPSQLRAAAAESAMLMPCAAELEPRLGGLTLPLLVIAGRDDRLIGMDHHSGWLADQLPHAERLFLPAVGHMVHHTEPEAVGAAIEGFAAGVIGVGEGVEVHDGAAEERSAPVH